MKVNPHVILLDNMTPETLKKAVKLIGGKIPTEASGGINLNNIAAYARTGVSYLSIGAITHSAPAVDISLEIE
jgi:nicotinate-nucleotide pyrophosphorylase (carboxylating)